MVEVQETLPNGCVGKNLTLNIQINPIPRTTFPNNSSICPEELTRTYQLQGLPGSTFQWQVTGGTLVSGQGTSAGIIKWDSLAVSPRYTVIETSAAGCTSVPQTVVLFFDRSEPELLSVGIDEKEENLLVHYRMKNLPSPLLPFQVNVQAENKPANQWQTIGQSPFAGSSFTAPGAEFAVRNYRLQSANLCGANKVSLVHRPVNLTVAGHETSGSVTLHWTSYKGWQGTIRYEIWRQLEGQSIFEKLTFSADTTITLNTGRDGFRQRYRIKAVSENGQESWSRSEGVEFENALQFPNIITPNNDGLNETFTTKTLHLYPNATLQIYNRWGKEVYSSPNYQGTWNAQGLSNGTYYYLLKTQKGQTFKGWVEVVR